jgi:Ni/Fe-hydrogenase subunit HybB-like protein
LRVYQYATTPAPLKIPTTPGPTTRTGVVFQMIHEVAFFQNLIKSNEWIWLFGILFHAGLLLVVLRHFRYFTKLYATRYHDYEWFVLASGNIYSIVFWLGQIAIGTVAPMILLALGSGKSANRNLLAASILLLLGGIAQIYVMLIGGQAFPLDLFPGMEISSSFQDGEIVSYTPSLPEILLGVCGISIAMLVSGISMRIMPFLPTGETAQQKPEV